MSDNPDITSGTPPHLPTYNVRLSQEAIHAVIAFVFPDHEVKSCEQLASGKSFNNRIYFVEAVDTARNNRQIVVLKLCGHYFGARKVQNEVGSLLLLQKHCPSVPAPRIVAWSEDGNTIRTTDGRVFSSNQNSDTPPGIYNAAFSKHGWVLITRLPGRALSQHDLEGSHGPDLIRQAARHLATWRTSIRSPGVIGNTRFQEASDNLDTGTGFDLLDSASQIDLPHLFTPGGLILCHRYDPAPLPTPLSYYTFALTDQQYQLMRFAPLRLLRDEIEYDVEKLIDILPRLSFLQHYTTTMVQPKQDVVKFTHLDFSPRNILVSEVDAVQSGGSESVPYITGILDFEFSGFFPSVDEYLNMVVRQSDDWTSTQYEIIVQELARLGCEIPHLPDAFHYEPVCTKRSKGACSCDSRAFEGLCILVKIIENVVPWWIQEGSHNEEDLNKEVEKAAKIVREGISKLNYFLI